jgi:hypothetical protein
MDQFGHTQGNRQVTSGLALYPIRILFVAESSAKGHAEGGSQGAEYETCDSEQHGSGERLPLLRLGALGATERGALLAIPGADSSR